MKSETDLLSLLSKALRSGSRFFRLVLQSFPKKAGGDHLRLPAVNSPDNSGPTVDASVAGRIVGLEPVEEDTLLSDPKDLDMRESKLVITRNSFQRPD